MKRAPADSDELLAPAYDPYDLWATSGGIAARRLFYRNRALGLPAAASIGLIDWLMPQLARRLLRIAPARYPISFALGLLTLSPARLGDEALARWAVSELDALACRDGAMRAWGLGFRWMSKNGLYERDVPFITHTPYVMEALLVLQRNRAVEDAARAMFDGTWPFLKALQIMFRSDDMLALSYAPLSEPRIVVNANAYAAYAFALHARHGDTGVRAEAERSALRLARWVVTQQEAQGRWMYYADSDAGNFCDAFHTGFVIKNLVKTVRLLDAAREWTAPAVALGLRYLEEAFFDPDARLVRRFAVRDISDPFRWDLYDQAEYLGVLIDSGRVPEAHALCEAVTARFHHRGHWYCRIDRLGRRWGRDFRRWGIAPWLYQQARLERAAEAG